MMDKIFNMRGLSLPLGARTYIMGIINVTPDSFSDGGKSFDPEDALRQAALMELAGVDILDIGGQSTRPGYTPISAESEWERLEPVLKGLAKQTKLPISVDTYYPDVAAKALDCGVHVINDVSGVVNAATAALIVKYGAGWILMHSAAVPETEDVSRTVSSWMLSSARIAETMGVSKSQICLDPGIGFGKTLEQNYRLIKETGKVKQPDYAYLLGASRKRCIGAPAGDPPFDMRDNGTIAAHTIGILGGADIIRVHDAAGAVQAARVADAIRFSAK